MNKLSSSHPLHRSNWIWPQGDMYLNNCFAQFRHDFDLISLPEKAPLYITADQSYRLYINGRYICRGPARGYQSHWPFDEVDVKSYLQKGNNYISVEGYNPGIGTFQYLHLYTAGFICAAEWGDIQIHTSKDTWQMRRSPANNPNVARLSRQMTFQEDFDASKDDLSWIYSEMPPAWVEDKLYAHGEKPYGRPPWNTLEPRMIPLLREKMLVPEKITVHGEGGMEPGWCDCFNIAWQWGGKEVESIKEWHSGETLPSKTLSDGLEFNVEPTTDGNFRAITINLGAIEMGSFGLEVSDCSGDEIIDCHYFQYLEDGIPQDLLPVGNNGLIALATRLRTAEGYCRRMFYQIQGAKFVTLVFRNLTKEISVKAVWRTAEYPFKMRGKFKTSDKALNDIHDLCRHTQQICSSDAYIDTPWREQGQWWGDARIQAKNTFYLDGDSRLLRRGIYSIAGQETENGLTYGIAPCCSGGCILPDFSLTWILTIFDYYWQTGELDVFHDQHERIKQIFAYFDSPEACGENGLLKYDSRFWLFEDWASLPKRGYPTFLNLWHLYTLQYYEKLLYAAGLDIEADFISKKCAKRKLLLEQFFFNEKQELFVSGRELNESFMSEPPSLHDQVLAILIDLKTDSHKIMAKKRLLPFLQGEKTDYAVPTSFWCTYLFEAARKLEFNQEVLEFIRSGWQKMIPSGGTWEHFIWNRNDLQSCCHAWSAHPATHLVDFLGGIRQNAPEWRKFKCAPNLKILPKKGKILLPLPLGDFIMEWNNVYLKLDVPASTDVLFKLAGTEQVLNSGKYTFALSEE